MLRSRSISLQVGHTSDGFCHALQGKQQEPHKNEAFHDPGRYIACAVAGSAGFQASERAYKARPAGPYLENTDRDQEQHGSGNIQPGKAAPAQSPGEDIDPDMFVALQGIRRHQHHDGREEMPLHVERRGVGDREKLPGQRVGGDHQCVGEKRPPGDAGDPPVKGIDAIGKNKKVPHPVAP